MGEKGRVSIAQLGLALSNRKGAVAREILYPNHSLAWMGELPQRGQNKALSIYCTMLSGLELVNGCLHQR